MKSLLHKFGFGVWAIDPSAVPAYLPQVNSIVREPRTEAPVLITEEKLAASINLRFHTRDGLIVYPGKEQLAAEPDMVMVVDIKGPIMKEDFCGDAGTKTIAGWLEKAESTKEVSGVVLNIDSPGGDGYGMFALTSTIERMKKPVVSMVDCGMACSAAYGIAASTDRIFSSVEADRFGSIGTYVVVSDWSKRNEKDGIVTHVITATRSNEKLKDIQEVMKADGKNPDDEHYKTIRAQRIDPFNEAFIGLVQRNRKGLKDTNGVLAGRVFMASDALELGLIDKTNETIAGAIAAVRELAQAA